EIADITFSRIEKGETGLNGGEVKWDQFQIPVIDCNDNKLKTFGPNANCVSSICKALEDQKLDPMSFKGRVLKISRVGYEHEVQIVNGGATVIDGDAEIESDVPTEEAVREAVTSVLASEKGKKMKSKELREWVEAYLDDLGIKADRDMVTDIIDEERE
ncbi:MAG: hypothetical protein KAR20_12190, partial [Candidatus Heimdallarchaeota archaeon]|nr:hypothetical protein [Candidatus Heimdallarchaeota archaeon]